MNLGGYDIQFSFLNCDAHCHECGCNGHVSEFCYHLYEEGLPMIYVDDDGHPSFSPPSKKKGKEKEKEKEKSKDSNPKKSSSEDETAAMVDKVPNRGQGKNR